MGKHLGTGTRLEKCPFCGGSVSLYEMGDDGWRWYYIASGRNKKTRCRCRVFMESEKYAEGASEKETIAIRTALVERWNRRSL